MADVEKILQLVSEGALSPEEADEILAALSAHEDSPEAPLPDSSTSRHLRIQVSEGGRQVVNLRVPMNIAAWASAFLPGLPADYANGIRSAIASGERGPIVDINSDDGSRVLIVSE